MNHIHPFTSRLLSGLLLIALLFTACNSDQPESKTNFKYNDNTVRVRMSAEPDRINPYLTTNAYSRYINERIFMYLMDQDPQSLELKPFLAKSAPEVREITEGPYEGGTAITYELKEDAVWPDGTSVTAKDAEFSLKVILTPGMPTPYQPFFAFFKGFEIDPENPLRFTLYTKEKYILLEPTAAALTVYPKKVYDPKGLMDEFTIEALNTENSVKTLGDNEKIKEFIDYFTSAEINSEPSKIAGSGPYQLEKWETGQYLLLTKKKDWWGNKYAESNPLFEAFPDSILYKKIPDQNAAINALKDQELDVASNLDSKDFMELKDNQLVSENYDFSNPPTTSLYLVFLNNHDPLLQDKRVRRALAHLIDVDEFIKSLYDGLAKRISGPVLESKSYYNKELKPLEYDLDKAKSFLTEAGWEDKDNDGVLEKNMDGSVQKLSFEIFVPSSSKAAENLALFFQEGFKRAGVELNIVKKDFGEILKENVRKKDYQMYIGASTLDLNIDDFHQLWHTSNDVMGGYNYSGFGTAASDALIDSIRVEMNEEKRRVMYTRFQQMLYDETPVIFLFSPLERVATSKRFEAETSIRRPGFFPNTFKLKN